MKKYIHGFILVNIFFVDLVIMAPIIRFLNFKSVCDIIDIFVSVCSVAATIYLGVIANKQNKRLMELEENSRGISKSSVVLLEQCYDTYDAFEAIPLSNEVQSYETSKYLYLEVTNYGDAMLKKISILFGNEIFESHLALAKGDMKIVSIEMPDNFDISQIITIKYVSCYDVVSYATFKLQQIGKTNNFTRKYYHYEGLVKEK